MNSSTSSLVTTMFDTQRFGPTCHELIAAAALTPIGPGEPNTSAFDALGDLSAASIGNNRQVKDNGMVECCRSALWLLHNYLDESHTISQDIATPTGSFWHGIMHRREPDYGNAKYWFRQVGDHTVFTKLADGVAERYPSLSTQVGGKAAWSPDGFVDACQQAAGSHGELAHGELESVCREVTLLEWQCLFEYCYDEAFE
jgi:hypothetical protein